MAPKCVLDPLDRHWQSLELRFNLKVPWAQGMRLNRRHFSLLFHRDHYNHYVYIHARMWEYLGLPERLIQCWHGRLCGSPWALPTCPIESPPLSFPCPETKLRRSNRQRGRRLRRSGGHGQRCRRQARFVDTNTANGRVFTSTTLAPVIHDSRATKSISKPCAVVLLA